MPNQTQNLNDLKNFAVELTREMKENPNGEPAVAEYLQLRHAYTRKYGIGGNPMTLIPRGDLEKILGKVA